MTFVYFGYGGQFRLDGTRATYLDKKKEPGTRIASRLSLVVEAGGIEPPSENTSTQVSPSAVCLLGFPSRTAGKQAMRYGILWYTSSPKEKAEGVHH